MIKKHLTIKMFLVLLVVVSLVVIAMLMLSHWSFQRGFTDYLNQIDEAQLVPVAQRLEQYYEQQGGWQRLHHRQFRQFIEGETSEDDLSRPPRLQGHEDEFRRPPPPPPPRYAGERPRPPGFQGPPREHRQPPPPPVRSDAPPNPWSIAPRLNLFDADKQLLLGRDRDFDRLIIHPLQVNQLTVGWLGLEPLKAPGSARDVEFMQRQGNTLYLIAFLTLLLAAITSIVVARRLLVPIKALAQGATTLAEGDYSVQIKPSGEDELGQLARDFNRLADTLSANETARRRWIADISHELRTPLAVLRGEIEALQDGIRPCNQQTLKSLHAEVLQLNKLIDDLYQLSLSDLGALDYHKRSLDVSALLSQVVESHQHRFSESNLSIELQGCTEAHYLFADDQRVTQLFDNILENSRRYTDNGGKVVISCQTTEGQLIINVDDSSPGVSADALPQLFERLYREEASRNRAKGGAGLGLAIVNNIVQAHQGTISAHHSELGGLRLSMIFPITTAE